MLRFYQNERVPGESPAPAPRSFDLRSVATRRLRRCGTFVLAACLALIPAVSAAASDGRVARRSRPLKPVEQTVLFMVYRGTTSARDMARHLGYPKARSLGGALTGLDRKSCIARARAPGQANEPSITGEGIAQLETAFRMRGLIATLRCPSSHVQRTYQALRHFATEEALARPLETAEACSILYVLHDAGLRLCTGKIAELTGLEAYSARSILDRMSSREGGLGYVTKHRSRCETTGRLQDDWELAEGDQARTALAVRLHTRGFLPVLLHAGLVSASAAELPLPRRATHSRTHQRPVRDRVLTPKWLSALAALDTQLGATSAQIGERLGVSSKSAHHILERLVDAHLVTEHHNGEGRKHPLAFRRTSAGMQALEDGRRSRGLIGELAARAGDLDALARDLLGEADLGMLYARFGEGTALGTSVLLTVHQGYDTPPAIDNHLREAGPRDRRPHQSLDALEKAGLLKSTLTQASSPQRRYKRYELTEDGRLALGLWLRLGGFVYVPPRGDSSSSARSTAK